MPIFSPTKAKEFVSIIKEKDTPNKLDLAHKQFRLNREYESFLIYEFKSLSGIDDFYKRVRSAEIDNVIANGEKIALGMMMGNNLSKTIITSEGLKASIRFFQRFDFTSHNLFGLFSNEVKVFGGIKRYKINEVYTSIANHPFIINLDDSERQIFSSAYRSAFIAAYWSANPRGRNIPEENLIRLKESLQTKDLDSLKEALSTTNLSEKKRDKIEKIAVDKILISENASWVPLILPIIQNEAQRERLENLVLKEFYKVAHNNDYLD